MDCEQYVAANFVRPAPEQRFEFEGVGGSVLFFEEYETAVAFYTEVLGPPEYVEGPGTRGWRLGSSWLTLLHGGSGSPGNVEIPLLMRTADEADRLQKAFISAGATGQPASDQLMYDPVRACPVTDQFGTELMIYARLD